MLNWLRQGVAIGTSRGLDDCIFWDVAIGTSRGLGDSIFGDLLGPNSGPFSASVNMGR